MNFESSKKPNTHDQGLSPESTNMEKGLVERDAIEKFYRGHRTLFNARATGRRELWDRGFQIVTDAEKNFKALGLPEKEVYEKMLKDFEDEGFDTKNPPGKNY